VPTAQPLPTVVPLEAAITYCPMPYPYQHYYELAGAFEQHHPEIGVSIARDQVSIEAFSQNCDCFSYPLWQGMFPGKSELVRNLQPLTDAGGGLPDDFYPGVLDAGRWQGDLWAVPAHVDFYVVRYNKDLFDAAGIAYPEPGWTTDEFWQKAKALDSGEGEARIYGYVPGSPSGQPDDLAYFVEQRGGFGRRDEVEEITGLPPLEGTATTAAVDWYAGLVAEDGGVPRYWDMDWAQRMDLIAAGRVAMWTEYVDTDFPVRFVRGTVPLPLDGGVVRHWRVVGHMISAGSDEPDACWTWIQFLLDQPALAGEQAPVRHGFADAPEYVAGIEADVLAANRFSLGHIDGVARRSHNPLYLALETILAGEPVGLAVEQVVAADEALRDCLDSVSGPILEEHVAACREGLDALSTGE
jgi:ABC-type glycerol-3-phosphate transport system substrate-binding protein